MKGVKAMKDFYSQKHPNASLLHFFMVSCFWERF